MTQIPEALAAMSGYDQWILWKLVPATPKPRKIPINPHTLQSYVAGEDWQQHPEMWASAEAALATLAYLDESYGIGFIFTQNDPFFFLDIDSCLNPDNTWSPLAVSLMNALPGAAIEVSQSNRGLHIFGKGVIPPHSNKNIALNIELYSHSRFVALTGNNAIGDAGVDCSAHLPGLALAYFPARADTVSATWSDGPVPEWSGIEDDDELIAKALASGGAGTVFGNKASFSDLWTVDVEALGRAYPDSGDRDYDASSADQALATHLSFWTGKNCERIQTLMLRSGLLRDKWTGREDYLHNTILNAVSLRADVYNNAPLATPRSDAAGAGKLRATSDAQREYAEKIRESKLDAGNSQTVERLAAITDAKTWIDNQHKTADEIAVMVTPVTAVPPTYIEAAHVDKVGYQFLGASLQKEMFKGCTYIRDQKLVFTPKFGLLDEKNFDIDFGGNVFQLDDNDGKTTTSAWKAFTQSQLIKWRVAQDVCFRPMVPSGEVINIAGILYVNSYVPVDVARTVGDPSLFVKHLELLLPIARDREILTSYMAACVQHKGFKFQWAPLIQGTPGNGKTLLTKCVARAIGDSYTHFPMANEIAEKFNAWLFGKLFIGVEDVYVPSHKSEVLEVLKPMITNNRLAKRAMRQDQVTSDVYANFMLNSNHKDAIRKTKDDRRFAVFYSAQQSVEDLARDGMDSQYFNTLYGWLADGGYEIVSEYLYTYPIADEFNPSKLCIRAPITSSTDEALGAAMGSVEQEILEAVEEGRPGFSGGWISSIHLGILLDNLRMGRAVPLNKRTALIESLGYIPHPSLHNGRANDPIHIDGDKKSRLYIKRNHINTNIKKGSDVAKTYVTDQMQGGNGKAKVVFNAS